MPWPRRSEKERGNCGAAGDGGRVNNHSADDADKASTLPTRTLNASLSPVSRSLTSIQAKQPSQNSVSDRIHGMLKPRVRSVRERVLFFFDFDERCFAIDVDLDGLARMLSVVGRERGTLAEFDVAVTTGHDTVISEWEQTGATWAMRSIRPGATAREVELVIDDGP